MFTYGNYLTRRLRFAWCFLTRPQDAWRWLATYRKDILDVGIPWLSWPCVDFLRRAVKPGMTVFEWGGGGSTLFFLRAACKVITLEDHPRWAERLRNYVARLPAPVAGNWICVEQSIDTEEARERYVQIVTEHAPLDLLLVDGPPEVSRLRCIEAGIASLKPGGMLVLDNAYDKSLDTVSQLLSGWHHRIFWGIAFHAGADRTDVYVKPAVLGTERPIA